MNERALRQRWEKELKRRHNVDDEEFMEFVWTALEEEGVVREACFLPETAVEDLRQSALPYIKGYRFRGGGVVGRVSRKGPIQARGEEEDVNPEPDAYGNLRSEALSEYLGKVADSEREVRHFREDCLGGALLSDEGAYSLLSSPAAGGLRKETFHKLDIPIVSHYSQEVSRELAYMPGGQNPRVKLRFRIEWPGGEYEAQTSHTGHGVKLATPPKPLEVYNHQTGDLELVRVWPRSVLDDLSNVAQKLQKRYPWHQEGTVAHFVLTGTPPWVPPLRARVNALYQLGFDYGSVTLTVQPWVSADKVEDFYRRIQRQMLEGRHNRKSGDCNLAVFLFVMERTQTERSRLDGVAQLKLLRPSGPGLLREWNEDYPEDHAWHYKHLSNFWRDFGRGWEAVASQDYAMPERETL